MTTSFKVTKRLDCQILLTFDTRHEGRGSWMSPCSRREHFRFRKGFDGVTLLRGFLCIEHLTGVFLAFQVTPCKNANPRAAISVRRLIDDSLAASIYMFANGVMTSFLDCWNRGTVKRTPRHSGSRRSQTSVGWRTGSYEVTKAVMASKILGRPNGATNVTERD